MGKWLMEKLLRDSGGTIFTEISSHLFIHPESCRIFHQQSQLHHIVSKTAFYNRYIIHLIPLYNYEEKVDD